ncbi:MAG: sigma-70 family RNA polymerase sigma factor [Planctomycetes bacterium]|nr:sigma-70 family RNA polymerase sigma factor [Planctomycetota bacterium]
MPPDPHSNTTLHLAAAIAGDMSSLGWLVAHLSPLLLAQARWRLGATLRSACDPEDLVQDAWLVALPRLRDLMPRDGRTTPVLLRFLATTIVQRVNNLARDLLRRRGTGGAAAGHDPAAVTAAQTGVVTAAVRHELREALLVTIDSLDARDREVLLLRGVEQRSLQTTAELLGVSTDAVSMRFARALARLRQHLPSALADDLAG